jgi:hypothetical protein
LFFLSTTLAFAQMPRLEAGVAIGGIRENVFGDYPVTAGGRVSVRLLPFLGAEAEVNRFPVGGGTASFPATQGLFGLRAGWRVGPIGIYGKVRPGFVRFDVNSLASPGTRAALDAGGILELYSSRHLAARFDFGDTVVFYGSNFSIPGGPPPGLLVVPGTRHQLQWSVGVSGWF